MKSNEALCLKDYYDKDGNIVLSAGNIYVVTKGSWAGFSCTSDVTIQLPQKNGEKQKEVLLPRDDANARLSPSCMLCDLLMIHYHKGNIEVESGQPFSFYEPAVVSEHGKINTHRFKIMKDITDLYDVLVSAGRILDDWRTSGGISQPWKFVPLDELVDGLNFLKDLCALEKEADPQNLFLPELQKNIYGLEETAAKAAMYENDKDPEQELHTFLTDYLSSVLKEMDGPEDEIEHE